MATIKHDKTCFLVIWINLMTVVEEQNPTKHCVGLFKICQNMLKLLQWPLSPGATLKRRSLSSLDSVVWSPVFSQPASI